MAGAAIGESQIQQLLRIAKAVNSTLDVQSVLQTIVDTVCDFTNWRMASIAVVRRDIGEVVFMAQHGFGRRQSDAHWRIEDSLTPRVTEAGKTFVVADTHVLADLPAVQASSEVAGYRSMVIVPLLHVQPPSALWLCRESPSEFTDDDVAFAEAVADHAAIAMRNAVLYRQATERSEELARVNNALSVLLQAVLEHRTIEELLRTTTTLLKKPLWFEDAFGRRIPDESGPSTEGLIGPDGPQHWTTSHGHAIAVPIVGGENRYGWLLSAEERPFADFEMQVLQQAAMAFSLLFLGERVRYETESQLRTDLFTTLVGSERPDVSSELQRRSRALHLDLPEPARVCLIDLRLGAGEDIEHQRRLRDALRVVTTRLPSRLIALQEGNIAMLVAEEETQRAPALISELRRQIRGSSPLVAIGAIAETPQGYLYSFRTAQKIVRAARFLRLQNRVLRSGDIGIFALLLDESRASELDDFRKNVFSGLRRCDGNGKLWSTLEALCDHGFAFGPTAEALRIHVSTLRYRMDRLRTVAALDWSTANARLEIEVAVMLERMSLPAPDF